MPEPDSGSLATYRQAGHGVRRDGRGSGVDCCAVGLGFHITLGESDSVSANEANYRIDEAPKTPRTGAGDSEIATAQRRRRRSAGRCRDGANSSPMTSTSRKLFRYVRGHRSALAGALLLVALVGFLEATSSLL